MVLVFNIEKTNSAKPTMKSERPQGRKLGGKMR